MSKKYIKVTVSILVLLFSFYYTNKIIKISRENDEIMIEIINYDKEFKDTKVEAIVDDITIIPGLKGEKINQEKSYLKMKKTGKFDKKLLVFEETYPSISITSDYGKFIISGNKAKPYVSIVFEINDSSYLKEILSILKSKNTVATFFIKENIFNETIDLLKMLKEEGHDVELLSNTYTTYEINKYNSTLKLISKDKLSYCLVKNRNIDILSNCESSKLHTIIPSIISNNALYYSVNNHLENGSIILIENNKNTIKELSSTINYINQKGKKIVLLKKLLEE